jgi:hypothetical protein
MGGVCSTWNVAGLDSIELVRKKMTMYGRIPKYTSAFRQHEPGIG